MEYLRRKIGISCKESPMLIGWRIKEERKQKSPHHQGIREKPVEGDYWSHYNNHLKLSLNSTDKLSVYICVVTTFVSSLQEAYNK